MDKSKDPPATVKSLIKSFYQRSIVKVEERGLGVLYLNLDLSMPDSLLSLDARVGELRCC